MICAALALGGCTVASFNGGSPRGANQPAAGAQGPQGPSPASSQPSPAPTVYVPVGGNQPAGSSIPAGSACTTVDPSVATCAAGVLTGVKVGTTTANAGAGPSGAGVPGGASVNVVVYDPKTTVFVPKGGTVSTGASGPCTTSDQSIATCKNGVFTGVNVGTTQAQGGQAGTDGASSGPTTVVVFDPSNPPPGVGQGTGTASPGNVASQGALGTGTGTAAGGAVDVGSGTLSYTFCSKAFQVSLSDLNGPTVGLGVTLDCPSAVAGALVLPAGSACARWCQHQSPAWATGFMAECDASNGMTECFCAGPSGSDCATEVGASFADLQSAGGAPMKCDGSLTPITDCSAACQGKGYLGGWAAECDAVGQQASCACIKDNAIDHAAVVQSTTDALTALVAGDNGSVSCDALNNNDEFVATSACNRLCTQQPQFRSGHIVSCSGTQANCLCL